MESKKLVNPETINVIEHSMKYILDLGYAKCSQFLKVTNVTSQPEAQTFTDTNAEKYYNCLIYDFNSV
uniref:LisH domain-containing protein n=1 Tax=Rhabditophanes sp. KR3021 TaxID=114890 RepID=A0AC35UA55_9BILA